MLSQFLSANVIEPFGWALVHSVWQLAAVGILFALAMATPLFRTPNWRYAAGVLAMAFMVAAPLATFWFLSAKVEGDVSTNAQGHVVDGTPVGSPGTVPFAEGDHALMAHLESTSLAAEALGRTREGNLASAPRRADSWKALAVSRIRPALPWLVRFWCVGVLLVSFWNVGGWLLLRRLRRSGTRAVSPDLIDLLDGLATRLRVSRPVTLLESALVHIPSVVGWLRPAILMPVGVIGGLPMDQLEAILATSWHTSGVTTTWSIFCKVLPRHSSSITPPSGGCRAEFGWNERAVRTKRPFRSAVAASSTRRHWPRWKNTVTVRHISPLLWAAAVCVGESSGFSAFPAARGHGIEAGSPAR